MRNLEGRVAVVTGGARGIGARFCEALAQAGAKLVIADVLDADALAKRLPPAISVRCDVSSSRDVERLRDATVEAFGTVDILVNNAAVFSSLEKQSFLEIGDDEWDRVMSVNVRGPFACARVFAPLMIARRSGRIVNVASATVFKGFVGMLHYVSSKGALVAMTRSLARELGPHNIGVNAIAPGLTMSEAIAANPAWKGPGAEATVQSRAMRREQVPDDLVGTLLFLAGGDSSFMTGQCLVVDGGAVMR